MHIDKQIMFKRIKILFFCISSIILLVKWLCCL